MKRTASIMLKVQKILCIVELVAFIIAGIAMMIAGGIAIASAMSGELSEDAQTAAIVAASGTLAGGIVFVVLIVLPILGMVFTGIAQRALETSKTREEARKGAIFGIVAGVITDLGFGVAGGVIMLVMKDHHYNPELQQTEEVVG